MVGADGSELWRMALGLAVLAATIWLPGLALCRALFPGLSRLVSLAAAPAVGTGALYVAGQLLDVLDLPVDTRLPLGAAIVGVPLLLWAERGHLQRWRLRLLPASIGLSWVVATGIWAAGIQDRLAVPPHNDGFNHGFFVARIARFATLDPAVVMPHDVLSGGTGVEFYPLALHQQAALLVRALDLDVAVAWSLTSLSLVVLALPIGMYALGRHLFQDRRLAAACALVSALMPGVTYSTTWWGGFALAAGFAVTPGALLLVLHTARRSCPPGPVLCTSLALTGVAGVHTSELTFVAVVAGVLILGPPLVHRDLRLAARRALPLAAPFVASLLLLAPVLAQLRRGLDERAYPVPTDGLPLAKAIGEVLVQFSFVPPVTPAAIVLASWIGIGLCLRWRTALPWLAAWGLCALLYVWLAAFPSRFVADLTATWYSDRFRLGYLLAFLVIPFVAVAVTGPRRATPTPATRVWKSAVPAFALVLGVTSAYDSVTAIRQNYEDFSLVDADARAAFDFLAEHQRPGERVLNQHQDGSPWMYALEGVAPVVALKTFDYERPEWADAVYLARHVHEVGTDPRTDSLLEAFHVQFVYVRADVFPTEEADIDLTALHRSDAWRLVFSSGPSHVYQRTQP